MKYKMLVISCCCTVLLIGCWGANKDIERYEQTASSFLRLVNGMQKERQISVPEQDAWGRNLLVETNSSSIICISQGTDGLTQYHIRMIRVITSQLVSLKRKDTNESSKK